MHSVITEDDTGHTDMQGTNKRRGRTIQCKQCNTKENQVK